MSTPELRVRVIPAIGDVTPEAWDACANPTSQDCSYNPFISHAFLSSLENLSSAIGKTGWQPQHLLAEEPDGTILGAVPCYLKSHSRGEYVFDRGWAEAYERAGGDYYPKLQVSVPFTPATGRRLLVRPGPQQAQVRARPRRGPGRAVPAARSLRRPRHLPPGSRMAALGERGFLQRTDQQFHWENAGYATFEDFLAALAVAQAQGDPARTARCARARHHVHWLTGSDLTEAVWDAFFAFYMETGSRKWGRPYLTRAVLFAGRRDAWASASC